MDTIAYRYKGPGAFYGIPSRDLTVEEFNALTPDLRRQVRLSGAYEAAEAAKPKAADTKQAGKTAEKES